MRRIVVVRNKITHEAEPFKYLTGAAKYTGLHIQTLRNAFSKHGMFENKTFTIERKEL